MAERTMQWEIISKFQSAVLSNDVMLAQKFIQQINTNSYFQHQKELPLHLSVKCGHLAMVECLIRNGANVNMLNLHGIYPLHYACMYLHANIARLLIEAGADINAYSKNGHCPGQTPLLIAVNANSLELVKVLVEAGADLELKDRLEQLTPLHLACKHATITDNDLIEYLISKGANVCTENIFGFTPLLTTIITNYNINTKLVKILLKNGADPSKADKYGFGPLLATIRRSSDHFEDGVETVQLLIDYGCRLNDRESGRGNGQSIGDTPLNISIDRNQDSITEKLIHNGADASKRNSRCESPLCCLLRDRKYDLAKQAAAIIPMINREDYTKACIFLSERYTNHEDPENTEQLRRFLQMNDEDLCEFASIRSLPLASFFPRLMHLCRCTLRKHLGNQADRSISKLGLPLLIKQYLLLKYL